MVRCLGGRAVFALDAVAIDDLAKVVCEACEELARGSGYGFIPADPMASERVGGEAWVPLPRWSLAGEGAELTLAARHLRFLARWPSRQAMQRARDRIREHTDPRRLLVDVDDVVRDVTRFLRGWAAYVRYGHSARQFDKVNHYAQDRIARLVAKRHKRHRGYGVMVVVYQSPDRLGLIDLEGTIVVPRPNRPWRPGR
jgi:hypothetical protein